jgi:ABC-type sugar transport system ATPase subunit
MQRGHSILHKTPSERIKAGMAFLTEDRRGEGLCMEASIEDNMTLICADRFAKGPCAWLNQKELIGEVNDYRAAVKLTSSAKNEQAVKTLSRGNQQKVVLAKWLLSKPKVVILDEPTRGIGVGAKYEIHS